MEERGEEGLKRMNWGWKEEDDKWRQKEGKAFHEVVCSFEATRIWAAPPNPSPGSRRRTTRIAALELTTLPTKQKKQALDSERESAFRTKYVNNSKYARLAPRLPYP